ncbi:glucosyltransferase domain-containing protein [Planococcus halotolerans]|uniref:Glucosyl transferase GtrII n=1 Tax=Planococcus halotolerans TaxID=2233542 RepID=A0A365L3M4_9BACL|nr:glucosyltransferase domain-containing protein [Planococcus halotolerans]RAZ79639.1 hypothetical protein DP120_08550 [Planococcus halotolerans]
MPEHLLNKWKTQIKPEWKIAFFTAFIIGLLTHIFVFTNSLPNHDGIVNTYSPQEKFSLGRFFLSPFAGISSYFDIPVVIGVLAIFYLSLIAVILTEFFELRKALSIFLVSGLVVTFPTISATFSYMFTADGYMAGSLVTALALLVTKKYKYGFIPGAVLFYMGVGVYQANLPFLLTLATIFLLMEALTKNVSVKVFLITTGRFMATAVIGMGLYGITFYLYNRLFAGEISNYQGLNNIGESSQSLSLTVQELIDSVKTFFFRGFITDMPVNLFEILNLFVVLLIIAGAALTFYQNKVYRSLPFSILTVLMLLSLPFSAYCLYFVSADVIYHMLMVLSVLSFYLLPILIYDKFSFAAFTNKSFSWITVIVSLLVVFNFAIIANISYYNLHLKYESTVFALNRVIDRIEQVNGLEEADKLAIFGRNTLESNLTDTIIPQSIPSMTGSSGNYLLPLPYHYFYMMQNQFGVNYKTASQDEYALIAASDTFESMEPWPAESSVQLFGDIVVIKFSE